MGNYPPYGSGPGPGGQGAGGQGANGQSAGGVGRRIEEAIELIEMELRHAAAYVNDAVIPQVRTESISALRNVASSLRNFADKLERQQSPPAPPRPPESQ